MDAFPLYKNKILAAGIRRALKEKAKQIFLTATPPRRWRRFAKEPEMLDGGAPGSPSWFPVPVPIIEEGTSTMVKIVRVNPCMRFKHFFWRVFQTDGERLFVRASKEMFFG